MMRNELNRETSPYLLQHKDNPVHWQPWGRDALDRARAENRPILLSIGYAACHWCHVMAHESFENPQIAAAMNRDFVPIKVDREERPDLDAIYQRALALMGEHGGWPLTMFLTPDGEPFWGGTYFPDTPRFGRPGFDQVLDAIATVWRDDPDRVSENVAVIRDALARLGTSSPGGLISSTALPAAAERLSAAFDATHGGIGGAPKFPNPAVLELMTRAWHHSFDAEFRDRVVFTLERMSQGGIYDHLGGGFARYATDAAWLVPHFEKMLYDNAYLIDLLVWAYSATAQPLFAERVRETAGWCLREMVAEGGAFAASLDADSEGEEGRFYVWTAAEIDEALGPDAGLFRSVYDVTESGNWEGRTILHRNHPAGARRSDAEEAALAAARNTLLARRDRRVRPGWDDKVLADWNGMMIAALAQAGAALGEAGWIEAARRAYRFVRETMMESGRLHHSWRAGQLKHAATLDDYAQMIRAALALHEVTGDPATLDDANAWLDDADRRFWDGADGGYFVTASDADDVILRPKTANDGPTPSANAVMVANLARLFYLTGDPRHRVRAEALIKAFSGAVADNFFPLIGLLNSADLLDSAVQLVIAGRRGDGGTERLLAAAFAAAQPNRIVQVTEDAEPPPGHPAHGKLRRDGADAAYLCIGQSCSPPITDPAAVTAALLGRPADAT